MLSSAELAEAVRVNKVTIEVAREATRRTVDCLGREGLDAQYTETSTSEGLVVPGYSVRVPVASDNSTSDPQIRECVQLESRWINEAYQRQP